MDGNINIEQLDKRAPLGAFSTFDQEVMIPELKKLLKNEIYCEIGVDKGKSLWIAREVTDPEVVVIGIDLRDDPKIPNTTFIQFDSTKIVWDYWKISLLFIDGDHSYKGCKGDIDNFYPLMKNHGVMMFHDCDESSPGVMQAVAEFVNTHTVERFELFKRTDKNTSMAKIQL